jgi:hypothetical protein
LTLTSVRRQRIAGIGRVKAATDLGTRLGAVFAVAKAIATLTQRGEIRPSVSIA